MIVKFEVSVHDHALFNKISSIMKNILCKLILLQYTNKSSSSKGNSNYPVAETKSYKGCDNFLTPYCLCLSSVLEMLVIAFDRSHSSIHIIAHDLNSYKYCEGSEKL